MLTTQRAEISFRQFDLLQMVLVLTETYLSVVATNGLENAHQFEKLKKWKDYAANIAYILFGVESPQGFSVKKSDFEFSFALLSV